MLGNKKSARNVEISVSVLDGRGEVIEVSYELSKASISGTISYYKRLSLIRIP